MVIIVSCLNGRGSQIIGMMPILVKRGSFVKHSDQHLQVNDFMLNTYNICNMQVPQAFSMPVKPPVKLRSRLEDEIAVCAF